MVPWSVQEIDETYVGGEEPGHPGRPGRDSKKKVPVGVALELVETQDGLFIHVLRGCLTSARISAGSKDEG